MWLPSLFPLPPTYPPPLTPPRSVVQLDRGQTITVTKDELEGENFSFLWFCHLKKKKGKKIQLEHFHAWFQTARVFCWDTGRCLLLYAAPGSQFKASSYCFEQWDAVIVWLRQWAFLQQRKEWTVPGGVLVNADNGLRWCERRWRGLITLTM